MALNEQFQVLLGAISGKLEGSINALNKIINGKLEGALMCLIKALKAI